MHVKIGSTCKKKYVTFAFLDLFILLDVRYPIPFIFLYMKFCPYSWLNIYIYIYSLIPFFLNSISLGIKIVSLPLGITQSLLQLRCFLPDSQ